MHILHKTLLIFSIYLTSESPLLKERRTLKKSPSFSFEEKEFKIEVF